MNSSPAKQEMNDLKRLWRSMGMLIILWYNGLINSTKLGFIDETGGAYEFRIASRYSAC